MINHMGKHPFVCCVDYICGDDAGQAGRERRCSNIYSPASCPPIRFDGDSRAMTVRLLSEADAAVLDEFLAGHRDSSMLLRGNARLGGLEYRGEKYQAVYAAA